MLIAVVSSGPAAAQTADAPDTAAAHADADDADDADDDDEGDDDDDNDDDDSGDSSDSDDGSGDDDSSSGDSSSSGDDSSSSGDDSSGDDDDTEEGSGGDDDDDSGGSDGCGKSYPIGDHSLTLDVAGTTRQYLFVVPPGYDPDGPNPLFFGMHGATWDGASARRSYSMESYIDSAIHVFPDGIDGRWDLSPAGVDVQFFDAMVAFARENTCIDDDRIFVHGHSMGGMVSNLLGCARGDVVRAIAPSAGSGPRGTCTGQVPALLAHGTDDETVPFDWGVQSRDHWLEANSCGDTTTDFDPSPCVEYEGCDGGFPVVWCEHTGMGHRVPSYYPDAVWNFYNQF
jgi:poly(3-hydroxybutyrate) depolymerase